MAEVTDDEHRSLWDRTAPARPRRPGLDRDLDVDVVVVGAGIVGLSTALVAAERGLDVAVLEARHVGAGTSGATTGKFSVQNGARYHELLSRVGRDAAQAYADAALAGIGRAERSVERYDIECGLERPSSQLATTTADGHAKLEREAAAAAELGLRPRWGSELVDVPVPARAVLTFRDELQVHPQAYLAGLVRAIVSLGGRVYESSRVTDLRHDSGGWSAVVGEHRCTARHVVMATRLPAFADRRLTFARATPVGASVIAGTTSVPLPTATALIEGASATWSIRASRWPVGDERLVVVGPDVVWPAGPRTSAAVERWATAHWPDLHIDHRWFAQDQRPADGLPLIGQLGGDGAWTATGFGKWGLALGTYAADVLVAGMVGDEAPPGAATFTPRPRLRGAGLVRFAEDNAMVAARWLGARVPTGYRPPPLGVGEGRVRRVGTKLVAEARDHDGALHRLDARCTHLGCPVSWNATETTWDCRCHGARFGVDGTVLEAPATEPLAPLGTDQG